MFMKAIFLGFEYKLIIIKFIIKMNNIMRTIIISTIFYFLSSTVVSQTGLVGEWVDYFPYHSVFAIAEGNGFVYGATKQGLIEYNKSDGSYLRFSKVEGLSDIGVSCIDYNSVAKTFVVGYSNGKIDLITSDEIITVNDLFRKPISGSKYLNNIYMQDKYAYIATGFGIVKFDVERKEFIENYVIESSGGNINVNDLTIANDTIYAATDNGLRYAYLNDPQITFYKSWKKDLSLPNPDANLSIIESFNDNLYLNEPGDDKDVLYFKNENTSWNIVTELSNYVNTSISAYDNYVLISHDIQVSSYNNNWNEINRIYNYGEGTYVSSVNAIMSNDSTIWVADKNYGLIRNPKPFWFNIINPKSPYKANVDGIDIRNNVIWIAGGSRENNWGNRYSSDGVFWRNSDLDWGQIDKYTDIKLNDIRDFIDVKINPFNQNLVYGASLGGGLIEFEGYKISQIFNEKNSALKSAVSLPGWVGVTGLDFDSYGNLWMSNSRNGNPISVYTNDKKWISYNFSNLISQDLTGQILVAENGFKWVVLPHAGKGILVFDDAGSIADLSDDNVKILNTSIGNGALPNTDIYCLAEDLDNQIWVGTAEGVAVFYSPSSVLTEGVNFDAQQIIVEVNGYYQHLLGTETVTSIAVDGANRKWFGTNGSGVFLMSKDGTKQLQHFTKENSPLPSNFIRAIKINSSTGEVLFGTNEGIVAYKSTATGDEITTNNTYAYPNPVPNNYFGLIAVKGLARDSDVRITDVAGNLVFSTISEGTQVVWDGNDMTGNRVATGVYLVFGIDSEGRDSQVAKILFTK